MRHATLPHASASATAAPPRPTACRQGIPWKLKTWRLLVKGLGAKTHSARADVDISL
jgi:hypothetical protein